MDDPSPIDILVVEDDRDAQANLRDILELHGYRVATAGTAAEALGRGDLAAFSAIVLDRRLPDATADELLPKIQGAAPGAAVIIVTGHADLQGAIAALRQGATDFILKPLNPDALLASLARVAERRRLALAKERSEAAFRNLVEAAECLILMTRPDHAIAYFSPFAERLTGYHAREVVGRDFLAQFVPEPRRRAVAETLARVVAGTPTPGFEEPLACRDGSVRSVAWNARLLADSDAGPALLMVGQDITYVKQAQLRALQAERLAAIGQMVAGLAHESGNALQRSQACLEMLALAVRDRPEALDLIARIQKAQDHLHHLYEDVRGYAAPIVLDRRPCNLSDVWREAWADLEPARRGKDATLRESADGVDLGCVADAFRLGQVFRNVLENALAAGRPPVVAEVHARESSLEGRPAIEVLIRDNGPGLDPEQSQRVFDPFFTTKAKGTGLGMAIARRVVEAHGGQIALGDPGDRPGAAFVITLPRGIP